MSLADVSGGHAIGVCVHCLSVFAEDALHQRIRDWLAVGILHRQGDGRHVRFDELQLTRDAREGLIHRPVRRAAEKGYLCGILQQRGLPQFRAGVCGIILQSQILMAQQTTVLRVNAVAQRTVFKGFRGCSVSHALTPLLPHTVTPQWQTAVWILLKIEFKASKIASMLLASAVVSRRMVSGTPGVPSGSRSTARTAATLAR